MMDPLTHDEHGRLLGGWRPPSETIYDASLLRIVLVDIIEAVPGCWIRLDEDHITRGEN